MRLLIILSALLLVGCGNFIKDIHDLQSKQDQQQSTVANLQLELNQVLAELAVQQAQIQGLSDNLQIQRIIDPCGNGPGFDEVLLETDLGLLAFFEQGSNRFLAILTDGAYVTTDAQHCHFTVIGGRI